MQAEETDQSTRENDSGRLGPDPSNTRSLRRISTSADNADTGTGAPIRASDSFADDALLGPVADGCEMQTGATTGIGATGVTEVPLGIEATKVLILGDGAARADGARSGEDQLAQLPHRARPTRRARPRAAGLQASPTPGLAPHPRVSVDGK